MSVAMLPPFSLDPYSLVCPVCLDGVRCEPPGYWLVRDGLPASEFSRLVGAVLR